MAGMMMLDGTAREARLDDSVTVSSAPETDLNVWSVAALLTRLDALWLRYAVDSGWPDSADVEREAETLADHGLAATAYLACTLACVARTADCGPLLAYGCWSGSALLARTGAVLHLDGSEGALNTESSWEEAHRGFLHAVDNGDAGNPYLLCAAVLDGTFLACVQEEMPEDIPALEPLAGGRYRVYITQPALQAGAEEGSLSQPMARGGVDIALSAAWRAVQVARELTARREGYLPDLDGVQGNDVRAAQLLASSWGRFVPELPPGGRDVQAPDASALAQHWIDALAQPVSNRAVAALRSRACLTWALACLAARDAAAGWAAVLSVMPLDRLGGALEAVAETDLRTLPPSIQCSDEIWLVESDATDTALRCPLAAVPGLAHHVTAIVRSRHLDGPYTSFSDLVRRVPALLRDMPALQCLVGSGALDGLHSRAGLAREWPALQAWCSALGAAQDRADSEISIPEVPPLDAPADMAAPGVKWLGWLRDPWPPAGVGSDTTAGVLRGALAAGVEMELQGRVVGRRPVRHGEADLVLLLVTDGRDTAPVLVPGAEDQPAGVAAGDAISLRVLSTTVAGERLFVAHTLAVPEVAATLEVSIPLEGDRERDLDCIAQVQAALAAYPGRHRIRLLLMRAGYRKALDIPEDHGVAWSPALAEHLDRLVGPGRARLIPTAELAG